MLIPNTQHTSFKKSLLPLWKLARTEIKTLIIASIALLISSSIHLLYPKMMGQMIDDLTQLQTSPAHSSPMLNQWLLYLSILFLIMGISTALRSYYFTLAGERIVIRLRSQFFAQLTLQEQAFFDVSHSSHWITRLSDDTAKIQRAVTINLSMLLRYFIGVLGSIIILFTISWHLTLIMLLMIPCIVITSTLYGLALRALSKKVQQALADSGSIAGEVLSNIATVQSFQREVYEQSRYQIALDTLFSLARKRAYLGAGFQGIVSFVSYLSIAIVIWYGGYLMLEGTLTLGQLTSFLLYTFSLAFSLSALSGLWEDLSKALGASEEVFSILQRKSSIQSGPLKPVLSEFSLLFEHVYFSYPSRPDIFVLRDFNLHVHAGETVAIVGVSGAGKSTLIHLLQRAYDVEQGKISISGYPLVELDLEYIRSHMALVSQEPVLFMGSIYDNILYGSPQAQTYEVEQAARHAFAHDFIMSFPQGYQTQVGERGIRLSGGQKQRIAIARALLKQPKILLLDEATSALDSESEYYVKQALENIMHHRTSVVIAHRLATVKKADRIVVLAEGQVRAIGTHESLLADQDQSYALWVEQQNL